MIKVIHETLKYPVFLFLLLFLLTACAQVPRVNRHGLPQREYVYQQPEAAEDGWETSSLRAEGVEQEKLHEMMHEILAGDSRYIHSILLIKNGKLIFEEYFFGYSRDTKHFLASVSKSVTSLAIGITIDKGYVPDVDVLTYELFPNYKRSKWIEQKYPIRLKHMLTMTAGLSWDALSHRRSHPGHTTYQMYASSDPIEFVLNRKLSDIPGQKFNYNSGLTILLGEIVRNRSGMYIDEFCGKFLFAPLGISDYSWDKFPDGTIQTDGGLHLRPRDMAKIGQMMLNNGSWRGTQIVPKDWIEASSQTHINGLGLGYGYRWWRGKAFINGREIEVVYASGHGGQKIFIIPQLDLVAVFTSKVFNPTGHRGPEKILLKYILPAMIPTGAPRKTVKLDPGYLDRLTGKYKIKGIDAVIPVFRKGDTLYTKTGFWETVEILPENETRFYGSSKKFGDFQVDVNYDENGNVSQLIAHFELRSMQLDKVE
jgi:CubicO group peptidase (beta-lactamase class C family)